MCHFIVFKIKHFTLYILLVRDWSHTQSILHYYILLTISTRGFACAVLILFACVELRFQTLTEYLLTFFRPFAEEVSFLLFSLDPPEKAPYCVTFCQF
jgi:hypothetical protein